MFQCVLRIVKFRLMFVVVARERAKRERSGRVSRTIIDRLVKARRVVTTILARSLRTLAVVPVKYCQSGRRSIAGRSLARDPNTNSVPRDIVHPSVDSQGHNASEVHACNVRDRSDRLTSRTNITGSVIYYRCDLVTSVQEPL